MSSGGSSGGSTTTTQSGPPKEVLQAYQGLVGAASNVASQPLQQYTDPMVAGFTPQQQAGFQTIDNAQGIGFPYINAAAQQYGQATAPLWDDLPQFDTQPLANAGSAAIANNPGFWGPALNESNYAFALSQGAPGQVDPYAQKARDYGDYASTVGGRTASGVQGYLSPALGYANQVGSMAPGIPGQVAPYSGYGIGAANSAQRGINLPGYDTLPTYLSPYTKNVTDALKDLFNQQNAEQFQQIRGNATTQGAYGGDREAVAEAITARQQQLGQAPAFSQALQSGFAQAQNELNTQQQIEQARQQAERQNAIAAGQLGIGSGNLALSGYTGAGQLGLGASGAATGAGNLYSTTNLGAGQLGIGAGNLNLGGGNLTLGGLNAGIQGSLGAAGSALGAGNLNLAGGQQGFGEFNTQQAQKLAADQANRWLASQAGFGMASLGNQALSQALTGANAQIGAGALQQQLAQEQLNIPYQQFLQAQAYPYQQLSFLSPIVEGTGSLSGGKGSTTYPGPSALSQIGGLGAAATGLSGLFGSGSGSSSGGSDFGGDYGGGFGGGPNDAFAKSGGRIGYAKGGTTPDVPGVGNGVPILDLSYIPTLTDNPVKSTWGLGIGNNNSSTSGGGGGGGGSFLSGIGSAVSAANTIGDAFGGGGILEGIGSLFLLKDGGRAGFALGGDTADPSQSDPTKLDPTRWSLPKVPQINLDHIIPRNAGPAVKQGKGPPELQPMPQQMPGQPQDSGLKGIGDLGKSLKGMNLFGSSEDSSDSADKGYAGGGVPLSAAINFGGGSPSQSMQVDELRRLPLERLYEMAVRYPQNTQQGQLVARVLNEKRMTPGEGTAPTGAPAQAPTGGMGSGGGYGSAQISGPAAGGMGGQPDYTGGTSHLAHGGEADDEPGFVTEDELDPHPIVHHDIGDTVIIEYPSEGKRIDLGLPVIKEERRHYAAGGASGAGHNMPLLGTQQAEPFAAPGEGARYSAAPFISNLPTAGGVSIPQLSAGFYTQPLRAQPGGGLGDWFQPMPQLTKFGTGPNGSTIFPSATAYTPGMAGVISGLTKGKGTIPPEFGGSAAATSAPSTPSPFDGIDPITAEFFGFGGSDSGGKRGGRIGLAEGGTPDVDMGQNPNWELQYNNFAGIRRVGAKPGQGGFTAYATPEEGIGAISGQLDRYAQGKVTGKPINTLGSMVRTWAPPNENQTNLLVNRAAQNTGFHPNQPLDVGDPSVKSKLIDAFIRNEQGNRNPVSMDLINRVSGITPPAAMAPAGGEAGQDIPAFQMDGPMRRGGRIGYAEGGEMDDPSEAPPQRMREPDDSGMSAPMPSEREVATRRLDSLLRKYEPKLGAPPASGREFSANLETYGPEKPPPRAPRSPPPDLPSMDERETASKSIDDLMAKYERPKPPVHGFSDIPPPAWPVPDDREFTAPMPERDTREFTAPTPGGGIGNQVDIKRALDDPAYRKLIMPDIASPGSGPEPDTAPTTFGQTGPVFDTSGADQALAGIGGALQGSPEEEAVARGVPVEQVRAERNKKAASQVAEQPSGGLNLPWSGIGATASLPPPASGIGAPAEAYRDTSRLTDIAGAPPIPPPSIPEPFKSVMPEPAVAPAKPAAAPTPNVTRVTAPPKEAAAPAAAPLGTIKPLPTDAVVNGKVWRDGKMIGPAENVPRVTASPQVTGTGKPYTPATQEGKQAAAETAPAGKITEAQLRAQYDAAKRIPNNAGQSESWEQYRDRNTDILHQDGVQRLLPDATPNPDAKWRTQEERDAKVPPGQGSGSGGVKGLSPMMSPVADALLNSPEAKQLGLTKANAAGILGHLPVESYGGDPTAFNPNDPNGGSRGVMQWQPDRWQNGLAWASKNGIADFATNANAQARFGLYEVLSGTDGSGGRTLAALKEAGDDPVKSALAWNHFERGAGYTPGNPERMIASDQRQYNAERIFGALNGGTPFELGTSPGRSRGMPAGGSGGGGPRQPGPGEPEQVTADKNGAPKVTPAGQPVVDAFKKDLTQRTEPKDRNRLKAWMDSPSFLLFMIGAGMLASKSPFPGVALGEGLLAAGKSVQEVRKDQNREDLAEARVNAMAGRVSDAHATLGLREKALAEKTLNDTERRRIQEAANESKDMARKSQDELRRAQFDLAQAKVDNGSMTSSFGPGPDPDDPTKKVDGTWYLPKMPDQNKPNGGAIFFPQVGTAKQSTGEKAILDQMVRDGIVPDLGEAQKLRAGYKKSPDSFKQSAEYTRLVQGEETKLLNEWKAKNQMNPMAKPPAAGFTAEAQQRVQRMLGGAPGAQPAAAPAAPAAAPGTSPASPAAKPPLIQNGWQYDPDTHQPIGPAQ